MRLSVFALSSLLISGAQLLTAEILYKVTDLGNLGAGGAYAYGINNAGQVVGASATADGGEHAFLYTNGQMQDLGTLGGPVSVGYALNDAGQVTGLSRNSYLTGDFFGFLYAGGQMQGIDTTGNTPGRAINNRGQITGAYYPSTSPTIRRLFSIRTSSYETWAR